MRPLRVGMFALALAVALGGRTASAQDADPSFSFRTIAVPDDPAMPLVSYVEHERQVNDAIGFVLGRQKPLEITKAQRDTLQTLGRAFRVQSIGSGPPMR